METQREQELYLQELHNFVKLTDVFGIQAVVADLALFYPDMFSNLTNSIERQNNKDAHDKRLAVLLQGSKDDCVL